MDPEEKRRVLDLANNMNKDEQDPDYHLDPLGDYPD
jgi:hypothetical protein